MILGIGIGNAAACPACAACALPTIGLTGRGVLIPTPLARLLALLVGARIPPKPMVGCGICALPAIIPIWGLPATA